MLGFLEHTKIIHDITVHTYMYMYMIITFNWIPLWVSCDEQQHLKNVSS